MPWSVLDLATISDDLLQMLRDAVHDAAAWQPPDDASFPITVSGTMPEADRDDASHCLLSLYLLHVSHDPFYRSVSLTTPNAQLNKSQPLSLNLYYLLTAYANKNYHHEQKAMSIAMRCLHENAIVRKPKSNLAPNGEEYSVSMEVETADEMSRLWQALSTPLRLAVVYKVSIAFITPSMPPTLVGPPPTGIGLAVAPKTSATVPQLSAAVRESFFVPPPSPDRDPDNVQTVIVPGLVRPADTLILSGSNLDLTAYQSVYLEDGATEYDISAWKSSSSASDMRIKLPATVGTPPANTPVAGEYLLCVGSDLPIKVRSPTLKLVVTPKVDGVVRPLELTPNGSNVYTVTGAGFTPATNTQFSLGTIALTRVTGAPGAGQFAVDPAGAAITFKVPSPALPSGTYYIGIRVNQIDTPPSRYVVIP